MHGTRGPPLRGFAASYQKDGIDAARCVAASRLVFFVVPVYLGLTPQAMNISPLRGFEGSHHEDGGDRETQPAASRLHLLGRVVIREHVPLLRGSGWSPHVLDGVSRPAPKARQIFSLGREPQETVRPTPTSPEGATDSVLWCGCHDDWRKKWQEHSAI